MPGHSYWTSAVVYMVPCRGKHADWLRQVNPLLRCLDRTSGQERCSFSWHYLTVTSDTDGLPLIAVDIGAIDLARTDPWRPQACQLPGALCLQLGWFCGYDKEDRAILNDPRRKMSSRCSASSGAVMALPSLLDQSHQAWQPPGDVRRVKTAHQLFCPVEFTRLGRCGALRLHP